MKCAAGHCRLVEGILAVQGRGGCQQQASSLEKTSKSYDALHDLLHEKETPQVISDMIDWLNQRMANLH